MEFLYLSSHTSVLYLHQCITVVSISFLTCQHDEFLSLHTHAEGLVLGHHFLRSRHSRPPGEDGHSRLMLVNCSVFAGQGATP